MSESTMPPAASPAPEVPITHAAQPESATDQVLANGSTSPAAADEEPEATVDIPLDTPAEYREQNGGDDSATSLTSPDKAPPPSPPAAAPEPSQPDTQSKSVNEDAPPPPPKQAPSTPDPKSKPPAITIGRPAGPARADSQANMQDIDLTRNPSPAAATSAGSALPGSQLRNAASASVTSLHSVTSSAAVQTPSRPGSTQPGRGIRHARQSSSSATTLSLSTNAAGGSSHSPQLSSALIVPPLQVLVQSKEAKKSASFNAAAQKALDLCQSGDASNAAYLHPREIFEPLRLAISNPQTTSVPILITSLDLLSKLISHSFFSEPNGPPAGPSPLADLITHTITLAYSEDSPPQLALQVVKALMSMVLSTDKGMLVHQSSLLKAVRTVYNVFLLSQDAGTQVVAQGGLTQMVHHVFGRVIRPDPSAAGARSSGSRRETIALSENEARRVAEAGGAREASPAGSASRAQTPAPASATSNGAAEGEKLTLASFDADNPNDSIPVAPSQVQEMPKSLAPDATPRVPTQTISIPVPNGDALDVPDEVVPPVALGGADAAGEQGDEGLDSMGRPIPTEELFVKDAFLVFRALCKLSMKPLVTENERDLRSHAMRSKLLSLHLILTILKSHADMFTNPMVCIPSNSSLEMTPFLQATKQYLCLCLSRNALSVVNHVFELSVEIFWYMLKHMRAQLKKEIEVLLNEIFIPILEMRHSTIRQKSLILAVFIRLCHDPQALVELYINYDCDRASPENIYEKLMNIVSKIGQTHFAPPSKEELTQSGSSKASKDGLGPSIPPSLSTAALTEAEKTSYAGLSPEIKLRKQSLECLVAALNSLVAWSTSGTNALGSRGDETAPRNSEDTVGRQLGSRVGSHVDLAQPSPSWPTSASGGPGQSNGNAGSSMPTHGSNGINTPDNADDDVGRFESAKQRKTTLQEGIRKFNFKPKRGIAFLIENGFIRSRAPADIARFLLSNDGLSKAMIGEYLGEGDEENVATMHAFVDMLDLSNMKFVDALRTYLQSFRLPGESQKIDRFMLKFAERYMGGNPSTLFANADTAYILAFSVIMLNTDAHNKNFKQKRMTKQEFLKNNRGINDGQDLPAEFLSDVYDEIQTNEIKMKDEVEAAVGAAGAAGAGGSGVAGGLVSVGRDLQREAYAAQSENMANKTEALLKAMTKQQRRGIVRPTDHFHTASRLEHVRFMFEVAWMPFLAGISAPLQETDDMEIVNLCLEGLRAAIRIVCLFDLELERNAFVTTLAKFTYLNNLAEMKPKNVEAIKSLLDVAIVDGNSLKKNWKDVLMCVSQLERMQLISSGLDVPDLNRRESGASVKKQAPKRRPAEEVAEESRSSQVTVAADMVFSRTKDLSGTAIVDFVQALSEVSWEEIQSSGSSTRPRLFSLQKLVEISYYNMTRIRLEWSNIWSILGEHFNQVCCHNNPNVSFFALDALRQLAMNFLEKEELSHFRFQKDFLRPFEYTMLHNKNLDAREMVLQCLQQMLQARYQNLRSGWRTMFSVFSAASKVQTERVPSFAFELVNLVYQHHFALVVRYGSFSDFAACVTDFSKVSKFQKISLQGIDMLKGLVGKMLQCPECHLPTAEDGSAPTAAAIAAGGAGKEDPMVKYWLPVLNAFYEIIMTGEDLEVRRVALDCLFDTLKTHGRNFTPDFWRIVCTTVLFPIFSILSAGDAATTLTPNPLDTAVVPPLLTVQNQGSNGSAGGAAPEDPPATPGVTDVKTFRFRNPEELSVWLSTTLISALREMIDLYTFYFGVMQEFLEGLLDILVACICQENDTLARIGTSCFQQLLESNVRKLSPEKWELIVSAFVQLFRTTTAAQLFDPALAAEKEPTGAVDKDAPFQKFVAPAPLAPSSEKAPSLPETLSYAEQRKIFKQIIVKCVLQLLLIETTHGLLQNDDVYNTIPAEHLLRFMGVLDNSWRFARKFNADRDLRMKLWKVGFMKQLPNLLKQESSAAATLIQVLLRMYRDPRDAHRATRSGVLERLVPLAVEIIRDFVAIDPETQPRNVLAWTPVVRDILNGCVGFEDEAFTTHIPTFYPLVTDLLVKEVAPEMRMALREYLCRVGTLKGFMREGARV